MLSIDSFEKELQEEYGKIFNNIEGIKTAKKRQCSKKDPRLLPTSYKMKERHKTHVQDRAEEQEPTFQLMNSKKIQSYEESCAGKGGEKRKGVESLEKAEGKKCTLYDKAATDLEAVFNKYMMIDSNTVRTNTLEAEKNPDTGNLDDINPSHTSARDETLGTQIRFKTVHTRNDTLYIWTASV